jgi:RNA polymerase sigma factor (sigma-70 family)
MTWVPDPSDVPASSGPPMRSDAALLDEARAGDREAFGVLWSRHSGAGRRIARAISRSDGDDLLSEAYLRIFAAVSTGKGPVGEFRPYLAVTIRNLAVSWARKHREDRLEDGEAEAIPDPRATDASVLAALDAGLTLRAFRTLPERWQEVLWFTEVDGLQPAQVADRLDMTANSVAALSYRAREGLRQAWIQAHVDTAAVGSEHQWTLQRVGKNARGALSRRASERFQAHLMGCAACTVIADEAVDTSSRFTSMLLPVAVGVFAATGLAEFLRTPASASATTLTAAPSRRRVSSRMIGGAIVAAVIAVAFAGAAVGFATTDRQPSTSAEPGSPHQDAASKQPTSSPTSRGPEAPTVAPSTPPTVSSSEGRTDPAHEPATRKSDLPAASAAATPAPLPVEIVPAITGIDTGTGVLFPVVSGTASPGATVTVSAGGGQVQVRAAGNGTWRTGPLPVRTGTTSVTAASSAGTSSPASCVVASPVVSISSRADDTTITIQGRAGETYAVSADGASLGVTTTNTAGTAVARTSRSVATVTVHAVSGDRVGPNTAIDADR